MNLFELFPPSLYETMVTEGFVKIQVHPTSPLVIANYTPKAQYSREWNEVTRQCRGLIWHGVTQQIVARPFPKFFNIGELSDEEIPLEPFNVYEKMDGSLGILYYDGERYSVATRGSFTSDQARWATVWMRNWTNAHRFEPITGRTYLFEILYPENRIVIDYAGRKELVLLDVIDNVTGESYVDVEWDRSVASRRWDGVMAGRYRGFESLQHLLEQPQPDNFEGYVIRFKGGMRVKVKMDEYVRLHRIVTGVSTKTVWEHLSQNRSMVDLLDRVPDEFYDWLKGVETDLTNQFNDIAEETERAFDRIVTDTRHDLNWTGSLAIIDREFRKAFALRVQPEPYKDILFQRLDRKDFADSIWKRLKPVYERPFTSQSEDVA